MMISVSSLLDFEKVYTTTEENKNENSEVYGLRYKIYMFLSSVFFILGVHRIFRPIEI